MPQAAVPASEDDVTRPLLWCTALEGTVWREGSLMLEVAPTSGALSFPNDDGGTSVQPPPCNRLTYRPRCLLHGYSVAPRSVGAGRTTGGSGASRRQALARRLRGTAGGTVTRRRGRRSGAPLAPPHGGDRQESGAGAWRLSRSRLPPRTASWPLKGERST